MNLQLNIYAIYRWLLLLVTLYNIYNVLLSVLEYKQYYDKIPLKLRLYLQQKTLKILGNKISENKRELWLNFGLLLILMLLNVVLFLI